MKWKVPKENRAEAVTFFQTNKDIFKFGGGSASQFIFHAKQASISRTFPVVSQKKINMEDLKAALKALKQHNQTTDPMPDFVKNMYC